MKIKIAGKIKFLNALVLSAFLSFSVNAQTTEEFDAQIEQSLSDEAPMNLDYMGLGTLGSSQKAWLDPLKNMGEGQAKPAYSKYYWKPDLVLPIRIRQGMLTLINFPAWEIVEEVYIGDYASFDGRVAAPNAVLLFPKGGTAEAGADTNLIIFGKSGNRYVFYLKSEWVHASKITNSIVEVVVTPDSGGVPEKVLKEMQKKGMSASSSSSAISGSTSSGVVNTAAAGGSSPLYPVSGSYVKNNATDDWLKEIPVDPEKFKFDIDIYVPNPKDVDIAPERVWRDDIFTYIDLGTKSLAMKQRPVVAMLVEDTEVPVGFRTKGPNGRLMVVEGVGDMVLRNGSKIVCLMMRKNPYDGLIENPEYYKRPGWDIGGNPQNNVNDSQSSVSLNPNVKIGNKNAAGSEGTYIGGYDNALKTGAPVKQPLEQRTMQISENNIEKVPYQQTGELGAPSNTDAYGNPIQITKNKKEFAIEIGVNDDVSKLEAQWSDMLVKHSDVLGSYSPYFSIDSNADGKEIYHLRIGPVSDLKKGDNICDRLGKRGIACSVVRTQ